MKKQGDSGDKVAPNGNKVAPNGNKVAPNGNKVAPNGDKVAPKPRDESARKWVRDMVRGNVIPFLPYALAKYRDSLTNPNKKPYSASATQSLLKKSGVECATYRKVENRFRFVLKLAGGLELSAESVCQEDAWIKVLGVLIRRLGG